MADLSSLSDDQLLGAIKPASFTPQSFAAQYGGVAQAVGQRLGVDPNLVLGQLGLETGWGKSVIPGTNNLGNIKDFSGGGVAARDNMTGSNDRYRAYADPQAFADDYASLLARKYPGVVGAGSDAQKFTSGLAGYAEDPQYAAKVTSAAATAQRANPGLFARVGNAVASAISSTANAATPQELSGISDEDLLAALAARGKAPAQQPGMLDQLGHQLGLTARAAGHGIADAAGFVGNPLNAAINTVGGWFGADPHLQDVDTPIRNFVDSITPAPANATERVVGDIAGAVANPVNLVGAPIVGAGRGAASLIGRGALAGAVTGAAQPVHAGDTAATIAGRAGAGALGGAAGGAAGVALGSVSDALATGATRIANAVRQSLPSGQTAMSANVDAILQRAAADQNLDLSAIPQSILNGVRQQVTEALSSSAVPDAASLLRRAEGEAILGPNAGLTLGQATRNPAQYTAEMNLRGVQGAGEPLMERFANQNTGLINALNESGAAAAPGEFAAGQGVIDSLAARDASQRSVINGLYSNARDSTGRSAPMDVKTFTENANQILDQQQLQNYVPAPLRAQLNRFATGETPFNVDTAVQYDKLLSEAQRTADRAGDGNTVMALGTIRDALNSAPIASDAGAQAKAAFDAARASARARFGDIRTNPGLKAVVDGKAAPDDFFKRYVLNGNVGDVNSLLGLVPDQGAALRSQVVDYLKQRALSGASDEIGKFSQSSYNSALNSLGKAKLNALFPPDQVAQLRMIGRVASNIQARPAGAAVNESNTGAAVMNLLSQMSGKVGSLPGLNLARNSVNQFLNERAAGQALGGQIPVTAQRSTFNSVNQLLPLLPGIGGSAAVPLSGQ
ncbi:glucosaminidase domain-containing protein [Burkholderia gladioli]|uniref:glucosaminidase domain-containing protein n=1 Tax=Burkholderia gladioli TaxID=28095 RepID=UPI0016405DA3|nr:glucosaminidase domain-containing protein [Burkholderia gladioli]